VAAGDGSGLNPGLIAGLVVAGLAVAFWFALRAKRKIRPTVVQFLVFFESEPPLDFAQIVQQMQNHPSLRQLIGPVERKYLSDIRLHVSLAKRSDRKREFIDLENWFFPSPAEIKAISECNFAIRIFFASEIPLTDTGYLTMMEGLAHVLAQRYSGKAIVDTETGAVFLPAAWSNAVFSGSQDHRVRAVYTESSDSFRVEVLGLGKWGHTALSSGDFPLDTRTSIEHGTRAFLQNFLASPLQPLNGADYDYCGVPQRAEVTSDKNGSARLRFFRVNAK